VDGSHEGTGVWGVWDVPPTGVESWGAPQIIFLLNFRVQNAVVYVFYCEKQLVARNLDRGRGEYVKRTGGENLAELQLPNLPSTRTMLDVLVSSTLQASKHFAGKCCRWRPIVECPKAKIFGFQLRPLIRGF